jgi:hypothetical protein
VIFGFGYFSDPQTVQRNPIPGPDFFLHGLWARRPLPWISSCDSCLQVQGMTFGRADRTADDVSDMVFMVRISNFSG